MNGPRPAGRSERGLTLIEVSISLVVMSVAAFGIAASMMNGMAATRRYQMNTLVVARCQHYLETLYNLQVGTDGDAAAGQAALDAVFSGDPEVGNNPPSLMALSRAIDQMAGDVYEFEATNIGFGGRFRVRVSNNVTHSLDFTAAVDGNGDGVPDDGVFTMMQGAPTEQFAGDGCFENEDDDQGRELFCFEVWYAPPQPANAAFQLVFRGFRAQDP
jgi:prepilin-type N-terminal cleavage/methylation domain-containing protein